VRESVPVAYAVRESPGTSLESRACMHREKDKRLAGWQIRCGCYPSDTMLFDAASGCDIGDPDIYPGVERILSRGENFRPMWHPTEVMERKQGREEVGVRRELI